MEYVVTSGRPFEEVEALTVAALERQGMEVQRTFSLHSAVEGRTPATEGAGSNLGYSVLMLHSSGVQRQPLGLLTLYQRGERTVIHPVLALPAGEDVDADLVMALVLSGLEFCVDVEGTQDCIDPNRVTEDGAILLKDPVCGKWFSHEQAEAAIEYEGNLFYLCCPLCRRQFEQDPARYARSG